MEGINQSRLAEYLAVEPITMTRIIDRMEISELILRQADPRDRRAWKLYLTPKSMDMMEKLRPIAQSTIHDALEGITTDQRKRLFTMLVSIRENILKRNVIHIRG
jgi:DNA-binding MarR family transcriptional regulator